MAIEEELARLGANLTWIEPHLAKGGLEKMMRTARAAVLAAPGPVIVAGWSMGGLIARLLAHELPDKIVGVVGVAAMTSTVRASKKHPDAVHPFSRQLTRYVASRYGSADEEPIESNISVPTLSFSGTEDDAVSIRYARRLAEKNPSTVQLVEFTARGDERRFDGQPLPNHTLVEVAQDSHHGHGIPQTQAALIAPALWRFVQAHTAAQ